MSYVLITELRNGLWWSFQISDLGREPAYRLCRLTHPLNSRESWHGSMLRWNGQYHQEITKSKFGLQDRQAYDESVTEGWALIRVSSCLFWEWMMHWPTSEDLEFQAFL
jgi:hypothetical protein